MSMPQRDWYALITPTFIHIEPATRVEPDPKPLPADNESVRAIRALETITLGHVPLKETTT